MQKYLFCFVIWLCQWTNAQNLVYKSSEYPLDIQSSLHASSKDSLFLLLEINHKFLKFSDANDKLKDNLTANLEVFSLKSPDKVINSASVPIPILVKPYLLSVSPYLQFRIPLKFTLQEEAFFKIIFTEDGTNKKAIAFGFYRPTKIDYYFQIMQKNSILTYPRLFIGSEYEFDCVASEVDIKCYDFKDEIPSMPFLLRDFKHSHNLKFSYTVQSKQPFKPIQPGIYVFHPVQQEVIKDEKNKPITTYREFIYFVMPEDFPDFTNVMNCLEPMQYIYSQSEIQKFKDALPTTENFNKFWVNESKGDSVLGKKIRNNFFGSVAYANRYFSTDNQGWKTDLGMIHIIFGKPDVVTIAGNSLNWFYDKAPGFNNPIHFTFQRKETQFSPNHYELQRRDIYESYWFKAKSIKRYGKF